MNVRIVRSTRSTAKRLVNTTPSWLEERKAPQGLLCDRFTARGQARIVGALLAGGLVAAPIAAWLVQKVTARLLGAAVGGLIVITNARTILSVLPEKGEIRVATCVVLSLAWVLAVAYVIREHRKRGLPLASCKEAHERRPTPAAEPAR